MHTHTHALTHSHTHTYPHKNVHTRTHKHTLTHTNTIFEMLSCQNNYFIAKVLSEVH